MGMRMPETCWAVFNPLNPELNPTCYLLALLGAHHFLHVSRIRVKWQVINLRICCIWLVDSVESMMMHGLANPKSAIQCKPWYFHGGKQPGRDVRLSIPSSAEVKRIGEILLYPPLRLRDVDKDVFTSFFLIDTHNVKRKWAYSRVHLVIYGLRTNILSLSIHKCYSICQLGRWDTILTSRKLMWCYACSWDVNGDLTLSWPAGHMCPTYKESFQVRWDNSIPLFLHAAIYLEVSLVRWTSQNAFPRETAVYKWYLEPVWVCCGWRTPPTAHSNRFQVSFVHGCFAGKCILTGSTD